MDNGNIEVTWVMNCELCILSDGTTEGGKRKIMFFSFLWKNTAGVGGLYCSLQEIRVFPVWLDDHIKLVTVSWQDMLRNSSLDHLGLNWVTSRMQRFCHLTRKMVTVLWELSAGCAWLPVTLWFTQGFWVLGADRLVAKMLVLSLCSIPCYSH